MIVQAIPLLALIFASVVHAIIHDIMVVTVDNVLRRCHIAKSAQPLLHRSSEPTRPCHVLTEKVGVRLNIVKLSVVFDYRSGPFQHHSRPKMNPAITKRTSHMPTPLRL